jgi:hypothetical protein
MLFISRKVPELCLGLFATTVRLKTMNSYDFIDFILSGSTVCCVTLLDTTLFHMFLYFSMHVSVHFSLTSLYPLHFSAILITLSPLVYSLFPHSPSVIVTPILCSYKEHHFLFYNCLIVYIVPFTWPHLLSFSEVFSHERKGFILLLPMSTWLFMFGKVSIYISTHIFVAT